MLPPIDLKSLIETVSGIATPILKDKLLRNEEVIKILQKFNLAPEHPPSDFSGIYAYALVEYGIGKPQLFLELFRDEEIKKAFRKAFDNNTPSIILSEINNYLDTHALINDIRNLGIDARRELAAFYLVFCKVAKTSRTPSDVLLSQQITTLNQKLDRIPTLEGIRAEIALLLSQQDNFALPSSKEAPPLQCKAMALAEQMRGWLETLGYRFEKQEIWRQEYFEWIINIPVRRNRYDRVLIRGIAGEAQVSDVLAIRSSVEKERADEGWLVTARRISRAARTEVEKEENKHLGCYTFDELLAQDADFSGYLEWLEAEIKRRQIDTKYVPLACTKEEVDSITGRQIAVSRYEEEDGWIDGYIDRWLDDPAKEHISVLGEFGTGKTWFAFHYAWVALQRYKDALSRGVELPRLPLVIPLRDYAKAVSVESLFSEFFFRKHEIPLPGYSAFEQLNRMGKLLLIFDGFDEMAARVDRQEMINNFWELAKVVVPGAKVILTCRSEHFPEAKEGRALLSAELQASTALLTGETPQFEVLELEKFNDEQIKQVLLYQATFTTVEQVMNNPQLLDLARRPVMTELILEALPDIEAGKPVDMSRVYLYAVRRKIENDIKQKRTFTSSAQKLYFLCELSWEMLCTDQMSLNYRLFPDRIRRLFGASVQEEKDLDHWQFDMMGQTMLIRNADGDYTPAHRSLLEFFVAYKFAAEIGALALDFTELARSEVGNVAPRSFTWSSYFGKDEAPLYKFVAESLEKLRETFGSSPLSKAVLDLMAPMVGDIEAVIEVIQGTRGFTEDEVGYVGGNAANLIVKIDRTGLDKRNLSHTVIKDANFSHVNLRDVNFINANLSGCVFKELLNQIFSVAFNLNGQLLAIGDAAGEIHLWRVADRQKVWKRKGHNHVVRSVIFCPDGRTLASASNDNTIKIWDIDTSECLTTLYGHSSIVRSIAFSPDGQILVSGSQDLTVKLWKVSTSECLETLSNSSGYVRSIAFSPDGEIIAYSSDKYNIKLWDIKTKQYLQTLNGHTNWVKSLAFSPDGQNLASSSQDYSIKLWNISTGQCLKNFYGHNAQVNFIAYSHNGLILASSSSDHKVKLWDAKTGQCIKILEGHNNYVQSAVFHPDNKILASGGQDHAVRLWDIRTGECISTLQGNSDWVKSITFSPDSKFIASGDDNHVVKIWDVNTGFCIKELQGHTSWVHSLSFRFDGEVLASSGDDNLIKLWNIKTGSCIQTLVGHNHWVRCIAFSPDGQTLASGSDDTTIRLWDIQTKQCFKVLQGHNKRIRTIAFSPDGQQIVSCCHDDTMRFWNVKTGECITTFKGDTNCFRGNIVFSPDRQVFASGGDDYNVRLSDSKTGSCLQILIGHVGQVKALTFSLNGKLLASGSDDLTVKIWDIQADKVLWTLQGHSITLSSLSFSSDAENLASCSEDGVIKIWSVKSGECLKTFKSSKPYENMNITGATGLTAAEKATLKALGAVDEQDL